MIATTGVGIVLGARVIYGMANHRVLPPFLGNVNRRFATPVAASLLVGLTLLGLTWAYLFATSLSNAFNDAIADHQLAVRRLLYPDRARRHHLLLAPYLQQCLDAVILGVLPLAAAGFLGWIMVKSLQAAPAAQIWSLVGIIGVGVVLMLVARLVLRPQFFHLRRETEGLYANPEPATRRVASLTAGAEMKA